MNTFKFILSKTVHLILERAKMLLETLTPTELTVYECVINGNTISEIAELIHVQPITVKTHLNNIYKKLEFKNKYQLMAEVIKELKNKIEDLESKLIEGQ